jgi:glutaredoxin
MTRDERRDALITLLKATGEAHHEAFLATDGADPDWAMWYAAHLADEARALLTNGPETQTEWVRLLADLAEEHAARAPDADWTQYYAQHLMERFVSEPTETLSLYMTPGCPYCVMVLRAIEQLGIEDRIELRDLWDNPAYRQELIAARGRGTVPVLRCQAGEVDRWMPESRDIIRHLRQRFGEAKTGS